MQPITINITINITPQGVEFEKEEEAAEDEDTETPKLPGGVGFYMTDGDEYNDVEEGPYVD